MSDCLASQQPVFLRLNRVKEITGLSRSTLYAYAKSGNFPRQVLLTAKCVAWNSREIEAWIQDRVAPSRNLVKKAV
jgi:prophage regulatory protein